MEDATLALMSATRTADAFGGGLFGPAGDGPAEAPLRGMLADGIPISLIMDLAMPTGPHSRELLEFEGGPDVAWWEPR